MSSLIQLLFDGIRRRGLRIGSDDDRTSQSENDWAEYLARQEDRDAAELQEYSRYRLAKIEAEGIEKQKLSFDQWRELMLGVRIVILSSRDCFGRLAGHAALRIFGPSAPEAVFDLAEERIGAALREVVGAIRDVVLSAWTRSKGHSKTLRKIFRDVDFEIGHFFGPGIQTVPKEKSRPLLDLSKETARSILGPAADFRADFEIERELSGAAETCLNVIRNQHEGPNNGLRGVQAVDALRAAERDIMTRLGIKYGQGGVR